MSLHLVEDPAPPTTREAPKLVRYPQMRRDDRLYTNPARPRFRPAGGHRRRRHAPRNLAAQHRPVRNRDLYRRLIDRSRHDFPTGVLPLLLELVDLQEAGDELHDVTITQEQLLERIGGDDPRWGSGLRSIQRRLAWLADAGWISPEDIRLPQPGWQITRYRFHVPTAVRPIWLMLSRQAEDARQRGLQRHQSQRSQPDAPARPEPARALPPITTASAEVLKPRGAEEVATGREAIADMRRRLKHDRDGP
jgi:hypothetical protein